MSPDDKKLLERTLELAEENNKILRKLRSLDRLDRIMKWVYWSILILLSLGAYYFIQPYVDFIRGKDPSDTNQVKNIDDLFNVLQN